jgi:hypothetical protein
LGFAACGEGVAGCAAGSFPQPAIPKMAMVSPATIVSTLRVFMFYPLSTVSLRFDCSL